MGRREEMVKKVSSLMKKRDQIRNIGIVAHIDHGKTTLTDNFIAGSGLMSEALAGKQLVMDFHDDERERGITINAANISLVEAYKGTEYLINIIDTPGHVDFSGDVTRACRAVDGAIVVVCAVEGPMPQTETVLKQALKEKVKPILFINKVDRLIKELQLDADQMQERFLKTIKRVNKFIKRLAPEEYKEEWQVSPEDGSVIFGSAYYNWGISVPFMKKTGITFKEIYDHLKEEKQEELAKKIPVNDALIEAIITHLPNPNDAQTYRIPTIWRGDETTPIGESMRDCNSEGPLAMMVTNVSIDPHAGDIITCRMFSGTVKKGMDVELINAVKKNTIQQVGVYMGPERINVDEVPAGNIVAVSGLRDAYAGETVCAEKIEPFEEMKHFSEQVITKSIEAKNAAELPKLIQILRQVAKEDPQIKVEINEETGEHLISGMGELHLEVIENRIRSERGLDVQTSPPIIVYRETVTKTSPTTEGKSPNRHNRFYFTVEPLEDTVYDAMKNGEIKEKDLKDSKALSLKLREHGMDADEAKKPWDVYNQNLFLNATKGIQYLNETKELLVQGFREAMDRGPLSHEKVTKVKVKIHDAKLHEDAVHRGPSQVLPAVKRPIYQAMLKANAVMLEPVQKTFVTVPQEQMGSVTKELQSRRGQILNMEQEEDHVTVEGKTPIAEMFGFAGDIRSATQGKALWSTEYSGYERLPSELQQKIIMQIRERKGLEKKMPSPADYAS
jgi:elongation factor 2